MLPIVAADLGLRELLHCCAGWSFPSGVAGMVALFAGEKLYIFLFECVGLGMDPDLIKKQEWYPVRCAKKIPGKIPTPFQLKFDVRQYDQRASFAILSSVGRSAMKHLQVVPPPFVLVLTSTPMTTSVSAFPPSSLSLAFFTCPHSISCFNKPANLSYSPIVFPLHHSTMRPTQPRACRPGPSCSSVRRESGSATRTRVSSVHGMPARGLCPWYRVLDAVPDRRVAGVNVISLRGCGRGDEVGRS